jgi:hypothetical protein
MCSQIFTRNATKIRGNCDFQVVRMLRTKRYYRRNMSVILFWNFYIFVVMMPGFSNSAVIPACRVGWFLNSILLNSLDPGYPVPRRSEDLCRYSWTLYCGWNLGIWQWNWFSHPNIAEVVYVQVTPRNANKLD